MKFSSRCGLRWSWLLFCVLLAAAPMAAQEPLSPPTSLEVEREGDMFRGRWDAVPGASYYQVWVKNFGRWTFDPNEMQTSPFTSSFELRVMDERARFKVRAIGPKGAESDYSDEVAPVWRKVTTSESEDRATTRTGSSGTPEFDPKAPPPDPPTGLFTIWVEPEVIKLVWQESKGAKNYAVEEYRDGSWTSPPSIEFSSDNTALIKGHPAPGPYKFRVRAVGRNGRASEPSWPTTAKR